MTNHRRRRPKEPGDAAKGPLKKPRPVWFVTLMAFVLPGSGQVFNGAPARGVIMQFGMVFGAFVTYMLTTPEISPIGRMAGGLLVYVFSIVDANGIAKLRVKAWERIEAGQPPRPRRTSRFEAALEGRPRGAQQKKGIATPARRKKRPAGRPPKDSGKSGSPEQGPDHPAVPAEETGPAPDPESTTTAEPPASGRPQG